MFKHIVEIGGRYYIKRWGIVRMEYLSIHLDHWFGIDYLHNASHYPTKEEARTAFSEFEKERKVSQKFGGWL